MITRLMYKEVINDIKELKERIYNSPYCLNKDDNIINLKDNITFNLIISIIVTPFTLIIDLVLLPLELLYLVLYKIIWKEK